MPYLNITVNIEVPVEKRATLLEGASKKLAAELQKPERYVMAQLTSDASLIFGGSDKPAAYVELKSIGLDTAQTKRLSQSMCEFLSAECRIPPDRVYIEFIDIKGSLWGWNGGTF